MKAYLNWPFGSKGHYHLPNAISPVLMDVHARRDLSKGLDFVFLHDSWNVQGKPIDRKALVKITGKSEEELLYPAFLHELQIQNKCLCNMT